MVLLSLSKNITHNENRSPFTLPHEHEVLSASIS